MTKRQKLIKQLIEHKWQRIKENFGTIDSVEMEKEERRINDLKNKLPVDPSAANMPAVIKRTPLFFYLTSKWQKFLD